MGLTTLVMSNGVKVVLKRTDFSKDMVMMQAVRPGGQMLYPDADKQVIRFAGAVQYAMGAASFSPLDLQRILAGKQVAVMSNMGNYEDSLTGRSRTEDLETMLQLNYLSIKQPRRDESLFRSYVTRMAEQFRNRGATPEVKFADARLLAVSGGTRARCRSRARRTSRT